jgi:hypothetical protein
MSREVHKRPASLAAARIGPVLLMALVTGGAIVTKPVAIQGPADERRARWA